MSKKERILLSKFKMVRFDATLIMIPRLVKVFICPIWAFQKVSEIFFLRFDKNGLKHALHYLGPKFEFCPFYLVALDDLNIVIVITESSDRSMSVHVRSICFHSIRLSCTIKPSMTNCFKKMWPLTQPVIHWQLRSPQAGGVSTTATFPSINFPGLSNAI